MNVEQSKSFLMQTAKTLLEIDSPSGFTHAVVKKAAEIAQELGYATRCTNKGSLIIDVPGREHNKHIGLCAHVDTLGLMCRAITAKGELMVTRIGGPTMATLDGEYCRIYTRDGQVYTGTILSLSPASHVFDDAATRPRDENNMYVRLDEVIHSAEDVRALGIEIGDYVCYDPKTIVTPSGYLKSRFIDDKGSSACLLTLLKLMHDEGVKPRYDTEIHLTVYEEVGHGGATIPTTLDELLAIDMGCIGLDLECSEQQVSICAKDASGPYDYDMVSRLVTLAKQHDIDYAVDVYPHYSSDVTVAWRAGSNAKAALIGPGVQASHGMERTHWDGMKETIRLIACYLECM